MAFTQGNAVDLHIGKVLLTLVTTVGGNIQILSKTWVVCVSFHDLLSISHCLLGVSFISNLKSSSCTALATYNTTENINCIILHSKDTTALRPIVFLIGMRQWVFKSKRQSASPSTNHCHGQPQTPVNICSLICHAFERSSLITQVCSCDITYF